MTRNHDRNSLQKLWHQPLFYTAPIHTRTPSCREYEFGFFPKQKVDYAMQNFINRGFLFLGSFIFPSYTFNLLSKV